MQRALTQDWCASTQHFPPALYEKFNTETRKSDETCLLYSARLVAILDAYLESRKIDKSFEKLTDLLVADRIKSTLLDGFKAHFGY